MSTDDPTSEPRHGRPTPEVPPTEHYELRVQGHLGARWSAWFDGLTVISEDDGTTVIRGPIADQAALHGVLQRLRDLGITLLSLTRTEPVEAIEHPIFPQNPNHPTAPGAPR